MGAQLQHQVWPRAAPSPHTALDKAPQERAQERRLDKPPSLYYNVVTMLRRVGAILTVALLLATASGAALALHLHDGSHEAADHGHACPLCAQLTDAPSAILSAKAAPLSAPHVCTRWARPPAAILVSAPVRSPASPRAPPAA